MFHSVRLIERWGTGTLRMAEAYTAQDLPPPEFLYQTGSFIVRMQPVPLSVAQTLDLTILNERQRMALNYALQKGSITTTQYGHLVGLERRQSQKDLTQLVKAGFLVRIGNGPATRYMVADGIPSAR